MTLDLDFPQLDGAACVGFGDMFFPAQGERTVEAVAMCQLCPVKDACLQWALEHREDFGIWGGLTPPERWSLLRKTTRKRAKQKIPRKCVDCGVTIQAPRQRCEPHRLERHKLVSSKRDKARRKSAKEAA